MRRKLLKNREQEKLKKNSSKRTGDSFFMRVFKRIGFVFITVFALVLTLYFFVLPSVLIDQKTDKNILIISSKLDEQSKYLYFAHFFTDESKNVIIGLPADAMVEVPNGYGQYPLQSVYQLLKIDKKDDQFITATFSQILETSVDEIKLVDAPLMESDETKVSTFFLQQAVQKAMSLQLHKVLSPLYLHYQTEKLVFRELTELSEFERQREVFKTVSGDVLQYCSVAVLNASGKNGLARSTADSIENIGAVVVRVDDLSEHVSHSRVYFSSDPVDCMQLVDSITGIFPTKLETEPIEKLENAQQYRANVVIILGEE